MCPLRKIGKLYHETVYFFLYMAAAVYYIISKEVEKFINQIILQINTQV